MHRALFHRGSPESLEREFPSAEHLAEETAWDLAAEHCSCDTCKARGLPQCDECSPPSPRRKETQDR